MRSLPLLTPLLLLLAALFTTLTTSHPGGGEIKKAGKQQPKLIPNERARWNCSHKYKVMYSHYKLSGRGWNKTEKEIKRAVANEGIITRWKFEMNEEEDSFVSSVSVFFFFSPFLLSSFLLFKLRLAWWWWWWCVRAIWKKRSR